MGGPCHQQSTLKVLDVTALNMAPEVARVRGHCRCDSVNVDGKEDCLQ